jgi:hypothetical protein
MAGQHLVPSAGGDVLLGWLDFVRCRYLRRPRQLEGLARECAEQLLERIQVERPLKTQEGPERWIWVRLPL